MTEADTTTDVVAEEEPEKRGVLRWLVDIFLSGLLTFLPVTATLAAIVWLLAFMEKYFGLPFKEYLPEDIYRPGMGIVAVVVVIFLLGLLTRLWMVRSLVHYLGALLMRLPLVKTVYGALKDVSDFIFKPASKHDDRTVVMAVLPGGWQQVGFVTRSSFGDLPKGLQQQIERNARALSTAAGLPAPAGTDASPAEAAPPPPVPTPEMIAVYFPFSYQLGGFTYFLDRRNVSVIPDMTVEDVMRYSMMAWMAAKQK